MWQLTTKADVLIPLITFMLCLMIGGILWALINSARAHAAVLVAFGGISLFVLAWATIRVWRRYRRLRRGRCANLMCRGVVQRSQRLGRGFVVCPTCGSTWPELEHMQFRVSSRA